MKTLASLALAFLSVSNAWAGNSDGRRITAEHLMMDAQARAYSYGLRCECTPKDFLYRVSQSDEAAAQLPTDNEFLRGQAEDYAHGRNRPAS